MYHSLGQTRDAVAARSLAVTQLVAFAARGGPICAIASAPLAVVTKMKWNMLLFTNMKWNILFFTVLLRTTVVRKRAALGVGEELTAVAATAVARMVSTSGRSRGVR